MGPSLVAPRTEAAYADHVNPQWVRLLDLLGLNVEYRRCPGARLETMDGRGILDCLLAVFL